MNRQTFLDLVLLRLRKDRPKAPETLNYAVLADCAVSDAYSYPSEVLIGFRTRGCRYNHGGGCTMCDYWISAPVPPDRMVAAVRHTLSTLDFEPNTLRVEVSGSFFDDWEVPQEARREILHLFSRFRNTHFVFETHANTITERKVIKCINILGHRQLSIEMGLESANPWILRYCVNKSLELQQLVKAINILKKHEVDSIVNIMLGLPFLSAYEMVADTVFSINWVFAQGANRCVLFPMNTKPWTLVFWMEENEMYVRPPLWALVDVLSELDSQLLPQIGLAWYRPRPQMHPGYKVPNRGPETCPLCYHDVMGLLDRFVISEERNEIVKRLVDFECVCKKAWYARKEQEPELPMRDRVRVAYQMIGEQVLGEEWWSENGASVVNSVVACPDCRSAL